MATALSLQFIPEGLPKRPYHKVTQEEKTKIIREVCENNRSIAKAAKKHGINISTAKVIIRNYKNGLISQEMPMNPRTNEENQEIRFQCETAPMTPQMQFLVYYPSIDPSFEYFGQLVYYGMPVYNDF